MDADCAADLEQQVRRLELQQDEYRAEIGRLKARLAIAVEGLEAIRKETACACGHNCHHWPECRVDIHDDAAELLAKIKE
jgi:hypothetical protein